MCLSFSLYLLHTNSLSFFCILRVFYAVKKEKRILSGLENGIHSEYLDGSASVALNNNKYSFNYRATDFNAHRFTRDSLLQGVYSLGSLNRLPLMRSFLMIDKYAVNVTFY